MQTWKVRDHNSRTTSFAALETYEISGESLEEAVRENADEIVLHTMPDKDHLLSIEGTNVKWSDSIFGGKGGAVAEIIAKISNAYLPDSPSYREKHTVYKAWIYADKDEANYTLTIKQLRELSKMTRKDFAEYFHTSPRNVENWEYERTNAPACLVELMEYKLRKEMIIE